MKKTLGIEEIRRLLRSRLPDLRERFGVVSLEVFGSMARGRARVRSDIDLLVELKGDRAITLLQFIALERELGHLLGRKVDLVEKGTLKPAIGRRILSEAIPI